ncbi:small multi-drug export protein [Microaerobacter geothermalis]|uniref:small multi-drug export protein n=1 Tax=Microaerobacter geothermalis TaxID=674972 RepID=UPI001F21163D|nr:small multi-drug export protein [Microaerobacter geothermalis]MCF6094779.1 small multi-drug export protein [Microaerobacter geothermalis]
MELVVKLLSLTAIGAIELWAAIPAGLAMKLNPVLVGLFSAVGAVIGASVIVVLGDRVRNWLLQRRGKKDPEQRGRIYRIWERYGAIGLGLLAPLITGAPLGAAIGISLGASPGRLMFWVIIGIIVWTILLTLAGTLGLEGIKLLWQ